MRKRFLADSQINLILNYNVLSLNAMKYEGHQTSNYLEKFLRKETNFFVRSLKHYSVLILSFYDRKRGYKIKI